MVLAVSAKKADHDAPLLLSSWSEALRENRWMMRYHLH